MVGAVPKRVGRSLSPMCGLMVLVVKIVQRVLKGARNPGNRRDRGKVPESEEPQSVDIWKTTNRNEAHEHARERHTYGGGRASPEEVDMWREKRGGQCQSTAGSTHTPRPTHSNSSTSDSMREGPPGEEGSGSDEVSMAESVSGTPSTDWTPEGDAEGNDALQRDSAASSGTPSSDMPYGMALEDADPVADTTRTVMRSVTETTSGSLCGASLPQGNRISVCSAGL
ncbi:hypothetical protein KIPB_000451 [Kipferlia bialata]|uniref:Uncharacterized protein n=1 Tax=Kipferlia bialata TaxID=797122 RepID=A0A9K3CMD1_9EUKA|nr:hypothetical protein KIPB_000451 [Kipferlia bialata]|eukprot:g451.t1